MSSSDNSEYKNLIKAIIDNATIDYIKLQHPNNRKKKYLQDAYINSIALFFDPTYTFSLFKNNDGEFLMLYDALKIISDGTKIDIQRFKDHLLNETIKYWNEKHFQNLTIPNSINVNGVVYFIKYGTESKIDYENQLIYLEKNSKTNDRDFVKYILILIFNKCNIELDNRTFQEFQKYMYFFLKVNACFSNKTTGDEND